MTRKRLILIATSGSAALLLGALAFQYLGGLPPCKLCIWQRYPHAAAILIGAVALVVPGRVLPALGAVAALTTAGVGIYHTGVERAWWQGPTTCSAGDISGLSAEELMDQILSAPVVRCDEVPWDLFGLSMASWNALIALGLAVIWIAAVRRSGD
ncbi:MAG: disulfide bond formation protein B [Marinibacterium sp.]